MRIWVSAICLVTVYMFAFVEMGLPGEPGGPGFGGATAEARKQRKKRAKVSASRRKTFVGINRLMGGFKWGDRSAKVIAAVKKKIRADKEPMWQQTKDPLLQDRLRQEMLNKLADVDKNHIKFNGRQTPWDVSLVDKEFAHKNQESLVAVWQKRERRFYFFYRDRLWKIFIAFNADMFENKTFEDFAGVMEGRFGRAQRKFSVTLTGDQKMDHLAWPQAGRTRLLAYDLTAFYGNFCLSLLDMKTWPAIKRGRELNSPKRNYSDPLVRAVTRSAGDGSDENEDIVDRITGKSTKVPGAQTGSPKRPRPTKRSKKVDSADPLKDLDI